MRNLRKNLKLVFMAACFIFASKISMATAKDTSDLVPIDLEKAGSSASLPIHVSWLRWELTRNAPTEVALMVLFSGWQADNQAEADVYREKAWNLFKSLTGQDYIYSGDKPAAPHKGIHVLITWKRENGEVLRTRTIVSDDGTGRVIVGPGKSFSLDAMPLEPGNYIVTVTALEDDPRFDGTFKTAICSGYEVK